MLWLPPLQRLKPRSEHGSTDKRLHPVDRAAPTRPRDSIRGATGLLVEGTVGPGPRAVEWRRGRRRRETSPRESCRMETAHGDRPCAALRCSSRTGMNDRKAARSCKSADRPSWRAASYAIGVDARRVETRIRFETENSLGVIGLATPGNSYEIDGCNVHTGSLKCRCRKIRRQRAPK